MLIFHAITPIFTSNSRFHALKYVQSRHHAFPLGGPNKDKWWWIGLTDEVEEGKWLWSDGRSVTFTKWNNRNPDDGTSANCVTMYGYYDDGWYDNPCSSHYRFICRITSGWYVMFSFIHVSVHETKITIFASIF